ncbi:MAG TPA: multifunctional CCA tRNA nucleotidyl transferase/2'3'-cyclic phosphodiesterase/2'nucleotidase/phosphatase [Burkholderiales bacterium]|nr:multifunctional CCA tRNA nucleotidyl transferase/2'3'-cyclic phosphodiesterase/2'nucleotidase/phosphatase [Burkholderiales bacterium]
MKSYIVGGAVRDELLGLPVQDRDHVVVGATPEEMTAAGFRPVGKDFPVFLHPQTHEEYALARTERKSGRGYKGFTVHSAPDVTLEQDLARRDLTINAIAKAADGTLVDPYNGKGDLKDGILRHVGAAFAEDPVRILRVARFAARFGFRIADETLALMKQMVAAGETEHLVPERVWQEFAKGLAEPRPQLMFAALEACGLRARLLPELKELPQSFEGPLPVRFAALCWPLAEAEVKALCDRLKVPNEERELALALNRARGLLGASGAGELLGLLKRADAFRRPERFLALLQAARLAEPGLETKKIEQAFAAASAVDAGEVARRAAAPAEIPALLDREREQAIQKKGTP